MRISFPVCSSVSLSFLCSIFSQCYFDLWSLSLWFKTEEPPQQCQIHLLQMSPLFHQLFSLSSPALELQQVPHGGVRQPGEVQVSCTPALQGRQNAAEPENAETEGIKTHRFRGVWGRVLARDKSYIQSCEKQLL